MNRFWIRFLASLPLADTTVLIDGGRAEARRGVVHSRVLSALADLAGANGIETACVHARTAGKSLSLTLFGVPESLHQRFRNVWGANWK